MADVVGITGGSGLVGRHLSDLFRQNGIEAIIFSRGASKSGQAYWDPGLKKMDTASLSQLTAMVHLAGAGVTDHRWSDGYKQEILRSRVEATYFLTEQIKLHAPACTTLIAASATGIYGPDRAGSSLPFREEAAPYHDFLADVCRLWEEASSSEMELYRTVIFRFGIVLAKDGGAYKELTQPMNFGVMPIIGGGKQVVPWIHIEDLCRMILMALRDEKMRGVYNAVAPNPVSHKALMKTIARAKGGLKIPVPVPGWLLNLIMGESSVEVLKSTTVSAEKILSEGFVFNYGNIEEAARQLESK